MTHLLRSLVKVRAAKAKEKKIERIGLYREDGKAYKTKSLSKLDEKYILLPEKITAVRASKQEMFKFPQPAAVPSKSDDVLISFEDVSVQRGGKRRVILDHVTLHLTPGMRVAVVGDNGSGKTTLLRAITNSLESESVVKGDRKVKQGVKVAIVSQHHAEELMKERARTDESACELLARKFESSELDARGMLGRFGITGKAACQPLKSLSGGQRVRVSLAYISWNAPDVYLFDEITNHCDMSALDALASALNNFAGAIIIVSHNRAFLGACCNELWEVSGGSVRVSKSEDDADGFSELFAKYSNRVLSGTGGVKTESSFVNSKTSSHAKSLDKKRADKKTKGLSGKERGGFI